ncbi:hypothetical protein [Hyalangium minutum]|uniref:hypothetical protein n=1 Tax=Hyalangium minutum TaxID=394096 RepID=UPI0004E7A396|nr:hypothetical protein [Hyalangium minutum]
MSMHRAALRFLAVILATSAVACGGEAGDVETDATNALTVHERAAYTVEQYRKTTQVEAAMKCSEVPDRCCTDTGFCCTWGHPDGPICH